MIELPPSPATLREQKAIACALGVVWLLSALWATQYAWTRSPDLPLNNAAVWVRQSTGAHPVSARWSWAQHNEHRLPLVKWAHVGAARSTGDFRSPVMLSVLLMSGASIILLMPARVRRGRRAWWDAGHVQPARVHPASGTPPILFWTDDETFDPKKCVVLRHQFTVIEAHEMTFWFTGSATSTRFDPDVRSVHCTIERVTVLVVPDELMPVFQLKAAGERP